MRIVQDNVATCVTAMMVTVRISTDALSSAFISPDLSDTNSLHQCCWSIMPAACSYRLQQSVHNIPVSFCYIRLIQHCRYSPGRTLDSHRRPWYFWTIFRNWCRLSLRKFTHLQNILIVYLWQLMSVKYQYYS